MEKFRKEFLYRKGRSKRRSIKRRADKVTVRSTERSKGRNT